MASSRSNDLIARYGVVLEATAGNGATGTFESLLPASKSDIQDAIKEELLLLALAGQLDTKISEHFKVAHISLATFQPDDDARAVMDLARAIQSPPDDPRQAAIELQPILERAEPVMARIAAAQHVLLTDISEWENKARAVALARDGQNRAGVGKKPSSASNSRSLWTRLFG